MVDLDKIMEARMKRREKYEDKAFVRLVKQMNAADALIGHLRRDGKMVFYITTRNGKHKEDIYSNLVDFLIRNHYV